MNILKIRKIGNELGVILPKDIASRLGIAPGDRLFISELPDGLELSLYDPEAGADTELAQEIMRRRHTVLRKLAK